MDIKIQMNSIWIGRFFVLLLVYVSITYITSCTVSDDVNKPSSETTPYATWHGTGPDKWASIWLINTVINPQGKVNILPEGANPEGFIYFDIPGVTLNRDTQHTSYQKLIEYFSINKPAVNLISRVLHDIDIRTWQGYSEPLSGTVEQGFRQMQTMYGRDAVHPDCYMAFFDRVAQITHLTNEQRAEITADHLVPAIDCHQQTITKLMSSSLSVPELPLTDVFDAIAAGSNVVFVDVRESKEYLEGHIPGAINMTIRDTNENSITLLSDADLIITYCVKDFRGFEMAKKLQSFGINNVALLKPYGLKGWIQTGLPLTKGSQPITTASKKALQQCIKKSAECKLTL